MCSTADSLMMKQYVCYNRQFNAHTKYCDTADSLMLTKYVL